MALIIWQPEKFAASILVKYYGYDQFSSFERQMNFYSFKKMGAFETSPSNRRWKRNTPLKFVHTLFTASSTPEMLAKIVRKTSPDHVRQLEAIRALQGPQIKALEEACTSLAMVNKTVLEQNAALVMSISPQVLHKISCAIILRQHLEELRGRTGQEKLKYGSDLDGMECKSHIDDTVAAVKATFLRQDASRSTRHESSFEGIEEAPFMANIQETELLQWLGWKS
eukprot:g3078.t1